MKVNCIDHGVHAKVIYNVLRGEYNARPCTRP